MVAVVIYTKEYCSYCTNAKNLLDRKKINYKEIRIDLYPEYKDEMIAKSNRRTVPQIFINGQSIGGYDDLVELERAGNLDSLLNSGERNVK